MTEHCCVGRRSNRCSGTDARLCRRVFPWRRSSASSTLIPRLRRFLFMTPTPGRSVESFSPPYRRVPGAGQCPVHHRARINTRRQGRQTARATSFSLSAGGYGSAGDIAAIRCVCVEHLVNPAAPWGEGLEDLRYRVAGKSPHPAGSRTAFFTGGNNRAMSLPPLAWPSSPYPRGRAQAAAAPNLSNPGIWRWLGNFGRRISFID
jgi:hypothetical protein